MGTNNYKNMYYQTYHQLYDVKEFDSSEDFIDIKNNNPIDDSLSLYKSETDSIVPNSNSNLKFFFYIDKCKKYIFRMFTLCTFLMFFWGIYSLIVDSKSRTSCAGDTVNVWCVVSANIYFQLGIILVILWYNGKNMYDKYDKSVFVILVESVIIGSWNLILWFFFYSNSCIDTWKSDYKTLYIYFVFHAFLYSYILMAGIIFVVSFLIVKFISPCCINSLN